MTLLSKDSLLQREMTLSRHFLTCSAAELRAKLRGLGPSLCYLLATYGTSGTSLNLL